MSSSSSHRLGGSRPRSLTICGSGNGAHALAVVASHTFDGPIDWLIGSEERAELLRRRVESTGLRSTGVIEGVADGLRTISADPAEVIPDADLILIVVPAYGHADVLARIAAHIGPGSTIGCLPARGGFEYDVVRMLRGSTLEMVAHRCFGLQTLPWSTRVVTPGELVHFGAAKATVVLAAASRTAAATLAGEMSSLLLTDVRATDSILNLTLGNPGQFIHPGLMYGHFREWDGDEYAEGEIPRFYAHATEEMGELVASLSHEAVAVAREIARSSRSRLDLDGVVPVLDWLRVSYSHATGDTSTVGSCFRTGPIQARLAPMRELRPGTYVPDFDYRYLSEDVPYGLVVTRAIAEIARVPTPRTDAVIGWAGRVTGRSYLDHDGSIRRDIAELPIPQRAGIETLSHLIDWYDGQAGTAAPRLGVPTA